MRPASLRTTKLVHLEYANYRDSREKSDTMYSYWIIDSDNLADFSIDYVENGRFRSLTAVSPEIAIEVFDYLRKIQWAFSGTAGERGGFRVWPDSAKSTKESTWDVWRQQCYGSIDQSVSEEMLNRIRRVNTEKIIGIRRDNSDGVT